MYKMPIKANDVKKLLNYKSIVKPDLKYLVDEVVRLYRANKMIFSVAERTAWRLAGSKTQVNKAMADITLYDTKTSQRERIAKDKQWRDAPIVNWYVKGTVYLSTNYKNKHSTKHFKDTLPEALKIRARV